MKLSGFDISVQNSGLVLDEVNYILRAIPDGKVSCNGEFGIKCSDHYKELDAKVISKISLNPMVMYDEPIS